MTVLRIPRCITCRFYLDRDDGRGQCRRFPPTASQDHELETWAWHGHWPRTGPDDWCGEYVPLTVDGGGNQ